MNYIPKAPSEKSEGAWIPLIIGTDIIDSFF